MHVTIINTDKRFPMSTMGLFTLLPLIGEKGFTMTLIDEEFAPLEFESQGEEKPFRFLALSQVTEIISYLKESMISSPGSFFLTLWIVDGDKTTAGMVAKHAKALEPPAGRAAGRRHLLLINDYKSGRHPDAMQLHWMAIVNREIDQRLQQSERFQPYRDLLLFILLLIDLFSGKAPGDRVQLFDDLFDGKTLALNPADFGKLTLAFQSEQEIRLLAVLEAKKRKKEDPGGEKTAEATDNYSKKIAEITGQIDNKMGAIEKFDHAALSGYLHSVALDHLAGDEKEFFKELKEKREASAAWYHTESKKRKKAATFFIRDQLGELETQIKKAGLTECNIFSAQCQKARISATAPALPARDPWSEDDREIRTAYDAVRHFQKYERFWRRARGVTLASWYLAALISFLALAHSAGNYWRVKAFAAWPQELFFWLVLAAIPGAVIWIFALLEKRKARNLMDALRGCVTDFFVREEEAWLEAWEREKGEMKNRLLEEVMRRIERRRQDLEMENTIFERKIQLLTAVRDICLSDSARRMEVKSGAGKLFDPYAAIEPIETRFTLKAATEQGDLFSRYVTSSTGMNFRLELKPVETRHPGGGTAAEPRPAGGGKSS
jgi:hypothetical protein